MWKKFLHKSRKNSQLARPVHTHLSENNKSEYALSLHGKKKKKKARSLIFLPMGPVYPMLLETVSRDLWY